MRNLLTNSGRDMFSRLQERTNKPSSVESKSAIKEDGPPIAVTARLEATKEGICPYCKHPMRKTLAVNNTEVWLCDGDRHVAPVRTT